MEYRSNDGVSHEDIILGNQRFDLRLRTWLSTKLSHFYSLPSNYTPTWSYPRQPLEILARYKPHTSGRSNTYRRTSVWNEYVDILIAKRYFGS